MIDLRKHYLLPLIIAGGLYLRTVNSSPSLLYVLLQIVGHKFVYIDSGPRVSFYITQPCFCLYFTAYEFYSPGASGGLTQYQF